MNSRAALGRPEQAAIPSGDRSMHPSTEEQT
jgi:hypothetical protein